MSSSIYDTDFSKYLPSALQQDPKMVALAKAATEEALKVSGSIDNVLIYSRIDELPEELVDILAYDMHVDWYDYSYPLAAKRDILKNSVKVHKKMGTKYAIEKALGALFPESEVEEWFEYEGEPGHFHIICDVTNQRITASVADIVRAVKMYKRLSAHLDDITFQSHIHGVITTHTDYFRYTVPATGRLATGTYPQRNRKGVQAARTIVVGTEAAGFIFTSTEAGTKPYRNIMFHNQTAYINAETALEAFGYTNTATGQKKAGETPYRSQKGANTADTVVMTDNATAYSYNVPVAGTVPDRSTMQQTKSGVISNEVQAAGFSYSVKPCGSKRKL